MSPQIKMEIHSIGAHFILYRDPHVANLSVAFDEDNLKLYIHLSQIFSIWIVPFHVAPTTLTTVLDLTTDSSKTSSPTSDARRLYHIAKQEDLYQTSEFVKFILPHVGHWLVFAWHLIATFFCVLGATLLWPMLWLEEKGYLPGRIAQGNLAYNIDSKVPEIKKH